MKQSMRISDRNPFRDWQMVSNLVVFQPIEFEKLKVNTHSEKRKPNKRTV